MGYVAWPRPFPCIFCSRIVWEWCLSVGQGRKGERMHLLMCRFSEILAGREKERLWGFWNVLDDSLCTRVTFVLSSVVFCVLYDNRWWIILQPFLCCFFANLKKHPSVHLYLQQSSNRLATWSTLQWSYSSRTIQAGDCGWTQPLLTGPGGP
jgi:hypothetical protein